MDGADVGLIKMTCRDDGMLLKPSTPAMSIDKVSSSCLARLSQLPVSRERKLPSFVSACSSHYAV